MTKVSGASANAETGSRASHRANSSVVSTKGFDPARMSRRTVLRNIGKATSAEAKRRIARMAYEAGIITPADLMVALQSANQIERQALEDWSPGEDALLTKLVRGGEGYEEISHHFKNRTRDACLGRAFRIGLAEPRSGPRPVQS